MLAVPGFFSGIGPMEILVILVIALVLFGNRLPEVARTIGKGYMEFKRGLKNLENSIDLDDAPQGHAKRGPEAPRALLPGDSRQEQPPTQAGKEADRGNEPGSGTRG